MANVNVNWQEVAKKTFDFLVAGAGGLFTSVITVISSVLSAVVNILVAFIFAIYLLNAKENLKRQAGWILQAFVKTAAKERICYVVRVFHETFTNFIVGQCMEAVIIGTLCAVLMTVLRAALCGDDRNGRRRDGADSRCGRLYRRCGRRVHGFYRGSDPVADFYRGFGGTAAGGGKFDLSQGGGFRHQPAGPLGVQRPLPSAAE